MLISKIDVIFKFELSYVLKKSEKKTHCIEELYIDYRYDNAFLLINYKVNVFIRFL